MGSWASFMHLPPRTCPISPSAALAAIYAVVSEPASSSASCVARRAPDLGLGMVLFPAGRLLWLRLALRSWQHAIHARNSVSIPTSTGGFKGRGETREKNTTLPATRSQLSEFGRSQDFGPGREAAFRPLGIHSACRWVWTDECQSNMPDTLSKLGAKYVSLCLALKTCCPHAKARPRPLGLRSTAHD